MKHDTETVCRAKHFQMTYSECDPTPLTLLTLFRVDQLITLSWFTLNWLTILTLERT